MEQFQAMLFVSSSDTQIWVLEAYNQCKNGTLTLDVLQKQDRKRHVLPKLGELSYGKVDRYWFWLLDYLIWKNVCESGTKNKFGVENDEEITAIKHYVFRRNRSIEHLHPQNATDNEAGRWRDVEQAFGNLAMISASFNSRQGNMQINAKLENIRDQISQRKIESAKLVIMSVLSDGRIAEWTPEKAEKHGISMYKTLKQYCCGAVGTWNLTEESGK